MLSLWVAIIVILIVASVFFMPLYKSSWYLALSLNFLMVVTALAGYLYFGASAQLKQQKIKRLEEIRVVRLAKKFKNRDEVIVRLKERLKADPESSRGWYLLGRIYASQKQFDLAYAAFKQAYALNSKNKAIAINFLQATYFKDNEKLTLNSKQIAANILKRWPKQPDTLNFLGWAYFNDKQYDHAIINWQQLLTLLDEQPEERQAVLQWIARAQQLASNLH